MEVGSTECSLFRDSTVKLARIVLERVLDRRRVPASNYLWVVFVGGKVSVPADGRSSADRRIRERSV